MSCTDAFERRRLFEFIMLQFVLFPQALIGSDTIVLSSFWNHFKILILNSKKREVVCICCKGTQRKFSANCTKSWVSTKFVTSKIVSQSGRIEIKRLRWSATNCTLNAMKKFPILSGTREKSSKRMLDILLSPIKCFQ